MQTLHYETLLILNRLRCARSLLECADDLERDGAERKETTDDPKTRKQNPEDERAYIEERLRKIAEFEKRYQGNAINPGAVWPRTGRKRP
jgi:hypothetical protein